MSEASGKRVQEAPESVRGTLPRPTLAARLLGAQSRRFACSALGTAAMMFGTVRPRPVRCGGIAHFRSPMNNPGSILPGLLGYFAIVAVVWAVSLLAIISCALVIALNVVQ